LRIDEREEISRGIAAGNSPAQIAARLGRHRSTVSREIARNGGRERYRAKDAEEATWQRAARPKPCRLAQHGRLRRLVAQKLAANWSPEQISCWLKKRFPKDRSWHVSHETIYRTLFVQARGALKKELIAHLRSATRLRRAKGVVHSTGLRGKIVDAVSIRERPPEVEDRAVPGTGRAICCAGAGTATLRHWSSVKPVL
jgi:IS30 family transposase